MRRTSEITGNCPDTTENGNYIAHLITGLKSALNGTHTKNEEENFKVIIKNAKKKLIALDNDKKNDNYEPSHDIEMQFTYVK
jgi:hypothetical protein